MRYIIILTLILNTILLAKTTFYGSAYLNNYYHDNILKLSDNDLDDFENGKRTDKFGDLNSSDDFISDLNLDLGFKYYILGHTQRAELNFGYEKYYNNSIKDTYYLGFSVRQYFFKGTYAEASYRYTPEIFVNRYTPVVGSDEYEDFDYEKNSYNIKLNYSFNQIDTDLYVKGDYDQLYYNKYFTEYDAENTSIEFGFDNNSLKFVNFGFGYRFKKSEADGEKAYEDITPTPQIKDASYESNLYKVDIGLPLKKSTKIPITVTFSFDIENRYFQSLVQEDTYHIGREETITTFRTNTYYYLTKDIRLSGFFKTEKRDVESPFKEVVEAKEYSYNSVGIGIRYSLDLSL